MELKFNVPKRVRKRAPDKNLTFGARVRTNTSSVTKYSISDTQVVTIGIVF